MTRSCILDEGCCFEDGKCHYKGHCNNAYVSNADSIQVMTEDEIARSIYAVSMGHNPWCNHHCEHLGEDECLDCISRWLRTHLQPATNTTKEPEVLTW